MKKVFYYLHGFLFATLSPLYVYVSYPDLHTHVSPDSIWKLVGVSLIFFICSAIVFFALLRDHLATGLITTCLILGILYPRYPFLFIISAILIASLLLAIVKKGFDLLQPCLACIVISIVITTYVGTEYAQIHQVSDAYPARSLADSIEIKASAARNSYKPDIYYIILDAYAGEKMLKELHAFNNSMFTSALKKRGFILPPGSKSNYLRTIHSLSSSLNMQYLGAISETMGTSSLWWPLRETFADNETRKFLESQGYKTLVIASGWDFTTITDADTYKQPFPIFLSDFEEFFIDNTNLSLFQFLGKTVVSFPSYDTHRRIILYEFEQLKNIPELESPKFTFVHIIAPHPPFVFDAQGNPINPDYPFTIADNRYLITPPAKYQQGYLDQLSFVNTQVLETVDAILEKSVNPPIIILQGDHGPGSLIDSQSAAPPCFYERYSILNAYYLPGIPPDSVPPDITPVNTFRMIFNEYFSPDLELLPNRQYFSQQESIHQFEDVTERTDDSCTFPH
jgi:hypothetical protein